MKRSTRRYCQLLSIVLLSLLSGWATLHSPTIFFTHQILLGSSLGVFSLLQFGWRGLPVGLVSALCTISLWGHPWAALILALQLLWQQLFLTRFNGSPKERGNGRIVLATIAFWLVLGLPLRTVLYTGLLQTDFQSAVALGLKEAVVAVVNAGLGLLLYLALQLTRRRAELSMRGLVFATLLLLSSLPAVLTITVMGQQITDHSFVQFRRSLEQQAQAIAFELPMADGGNLSVDSPLRQRFPELAFEAVAPNGEQLSSDPALFRRLQQEYRPEQGISVQSSDLGLLVPTNASTLLQRQLSGYWRYGLDLPPTSGSAWREVVVVQPAREQVQQLIGLMKPPLQLLGLLLIAAALISEGLTRAVASQFNWILGSLLLPTAEVVGQAKLPMPQLLRGRIWELNRMVARINALSFQLSQSEQRHRLLADHALDVITINDPSNRPTYFSPSIEKVRGWTVEEAMALPMDQHLTPEGCAFVIDAFQQIEEAIRQGLPLPSFRAELQQSHKNGSWIWTEVSSSCITNEAGDYICSLWVYRDISERKQLEQQLQQQLRTSLTAASIAHEINMPLSTIQLACQLAYAQLQNGALTHEQTHDLVHMLRDQSVQVGQTIERMRMLLRNVQTDHQPTDLIEVVNSAILQLRQKIRENQVQLNCQELADEALIVMGDATQLMIAISNLLRNAIEAVASQPLQQRQVNIALSRQVDQVLVTVADSGPGFELDSDTDTLLHTTKSGGTGLGLFVVRTCMTNHRGRLEIGRSSVLGGAEFRLSLSLAADAAAPDTDQQRSHPPDQRARAV